MLPEMEHFCCFSPRKYAMAYVLKDHKRTLWCHLSSKFVYFKELPPSPLSKLLITAFGARNRHFLQIHIKLHFRLKNY